MELKNPELYFTGQDVTVEMKQSQGTLAVIFGYLIPFFVLVISLLIFILAGIDEGLAGLSALGMLVPYYFLLYLFRGSLQKKFSYRIV
jgi:sigma-E factor negative regulatory protein RseC